MPKWRVITVAVAAAIAVSFVAAARQRAVRPGVPLRPVPTFSNEVSRIFQRHCQSCHHPGDIAPFSLMTHDQAAPYAASIKYMTQTRMMPPWKAAAGCGEFEDPRVMSEQEIDTIARWVDGGAPEGDPNQLPTPLSFDGNWTIGQPDLILANSEAYTPPGRRDVYRCFTIPSNLTGDRWVSAIDVHPGDRGSVHHVIAFVDSTGASVKLDEDDAGPGYECFGGAGFNSPGVLGGWAPGYRPAILPEDIALRLPAASRVVLQVHYQGHAEPNPDRTEIGVYYAKKDPKQQLFILPLARESFTIPPNDANFRLTQDFDVPAFISAKLWLIAPHMHLLGRKMKVEATSKDGQTRCLVNIEDWDFNWQSVYRYKQPITIPASTRLSLTATYDNSSGNLRNPNVPPKPVSYGEATTDEMCLVLLGVTYDLENVGKNVRADSSWFPKAAR